MAAMKKLYLILVGCLLVAGGTTAAEEGPTPEGGGAAGGRTGVYNVLDYGARGTGTAARPGQTPERIIE